MKIEAKLSKTEAERSVMNLVEKVNGDMVAAMKARAADRLSTLRMVKAAFKNKEIDQRAPLSDAQAVQVLTTLIKQRRESIEQFTKGNRPELAAKETAEIAVIEEYMPKAASENEIVSLVDQTIRELRAQGTNIGPKEMGAVMKAVQAKIQAGGIRADGRQVSEIVKSKISA